MHGTVVKDAMPLKANTVFVIPSNRYMAVFNRRLHLLKPTEVPGLQTPTDYFFRALAEALQDRAICIVPSGTGTDGALGLGQVKGESGMAMVQDLESAKSDGKPRNPINRGLADYVLPPQQMPEQRSSYVDQALYELPNKAAKRIPEEGYPLDTIFMLPYRTIENVREGVAVTFAEVIRPKEALASLKYARKRESW